MAEGQNDPPTLGGRRAYLWTELFRSFQVALDPRKLIVAATGILVMSLGWYLLSVIFYKDMPNRTDETYSVARVRKAIGDKSPSGTDYTEADYNAEGEKLYQKDFAEWKTLHELAGPNGRLRTMPWYEYRGPNPFLLVTRIVGGSSVDLESALSQFLSGTVPVLVEPLMKLLLPVVKLLDPNASFLTRVYLILALIWSVATWAFFGGIITRIAAVQFSGKERITLPQATRFVMTRYTSYLLSPLVPLGVIGVIVIAMALYGLLAMIPILGDLVLYGLGMPLVVVGGIAMAVLLVGLVGYPLMYTTVSTEGSDTFDALSRSYNYVFQAPWSYLWYNLVAVVYGAAVIFFVVFMGSLMVYMGKWAVSQAPWSEAANRKPDFLFVYSPESFGWKQLLLEGSPIAVKAEPVTDPYTQRVRMEYIPANKETAERYRKEFTWWNTAGAGMVTFWMVAIFLLVIGFSYSYSWTAATMIYLLMRKKVDETELDEVYLEEEASGESFTAPVVPPPPSTIGTTLPVVPPPPAVPPAPVSPPPPPVTSTPTVPPTATTEPTKPTTDAKDEKAP